MLYILSGHIAKFWMDKKIGLVTVLHEKKKEEMTKVVN